MTPVVCLTKHRGATCRQVLLRIGDDFTGVIQVKCPRCRSIVERTYQDGICDDVA